MFGWGAMTMILSAVKGVSGLVAVRFFLGAFEAGLFPGMIYCLTFWYKQDERALRAALISACGTLGEYKLLIHVLLAYNRCYQVVHSAVLSLSV